MPRLSSVTLRVQNSKIDCLKHFYTKVLGVTNVLSWDSEEDIDIFAIPQHYPKYPECIQKHDSADLKIVSKSNLGPYNPSREDLYWKIGLAVNDVNAAADTINAASKTSLNTKANEASIQHSVPHIHLHRREGSTSEVSNIGTWTPSLYLLKAEKERGVTINFTLRLHDRRQHF